MTPINTSVRDIARVRRLKPIDGKQRPSPPLGLRQRLTPNRRAANPQLLHTRVERTGIQAESAGRAVRAFDLPAAAWQTCRMLRPVVACRVSSRRRVRLARLDRQTRGGASHWTQLNSIQLQDGAGRQDDRALEDILQFADVAGPVVAGQPVEDGRRERIHFPTQPARLAGDQVGSEQGDVLAPLAQRRQWMGKIASRW